MMPSDGRHGARHVAEVAVGSGLGHRLAPAVEDRLDGDADKSEAEHIGHDHTSRRARPGRGAT